MSNATVLLPLPLTPVITVSLSRGIERSTLRRLCSRACTISMFGPRCRRRCAAAAATRRRSGPRKSHPWGSSAHVRVRRRSRERPSASQPAPRYAQRYFADRARGRDESCTRAGLGVKVRRGRAVRGRCGSRRRGARRRACPSRRSRRRRRRLPGRGRRSSRPRRSRRGCARSRSPNGPRRRAAAARRASFAMSAKCRPVVGSSNRKSVPPALRAAALGFRELARELQALRLAAR